MESADDPKAEAAALHSLSLTVDVTLAFFDKYLRDKRTVCSTDFTNLGRRLLLNTTRPELTSPYSLSNSRVRCGPGMDDVSAESELPKPYDARLMRCYPVNTQVNSLVNNDPVDDALRANGSEPPALVKISAIMFVATATCESIPNSIITGTVIRDVAARDNTDDACEEENQGESNELTCRHEFSIETRLRSGSVDSFFGNDGHHD